MSAQVERRLMTPAFSHANLGKFLPTLRRIGLRLVDAIQKQPAVCEDMLKLCVKYTADVIGLLTFGHDLKTLDQETNALATLMDETFRILGLRSMGTIKWYKLPFFGDSIDGGARLRRDVVRLVSTIIDDARLKKNGDSMTVLDKMIESNHDEKLDDRSLIGNAVTMVVAGTETTATTITWMLYEIAQDNVLQRTLRSESIALLDNWNFSEDDMDLVTTSKAIDAVLDSIPGLRSIFWETLRLKGPSPFIMLGNDKPIDVAGQTLNGNEYCMIAPQRWFHKQPELGGPSFDPYRHINSNGTFKPLTDDIFPFGFGVRICPGKGLAELEGCLAVAHLLVHFDDISLSPDDLCPPHLHFRFTDHPSRPISLTFRSSQQG